MGKVLPCLRQMGHVFFCILFAQITHVHTWPQPVNTTQDCASLQMLHVPGAASGDVGLLIGISLSVLMTKIQS